MVETDSLIGLGCDYVTVTATEAAVSSPLRMLASDIYYHQSHSGNESRPWSMAGFRGWRCGGIEIGVRGDEAIVRASGAVSELHWKKLVAVASNVTRFDVQATVRMASSVTRRISACQRAAQRDAERYKGKRIVRWVADNQGGYTLYLGSRQSLVFGRIYDKYAKSKLDHYRNAVRYEVQFQHDAARTLATVLERCGDTSPRFAAHCQGFFRSRGVPLEIAPADGATISCSRTRSDNEKNLAWLQKAVRPCVQRLMDAGEGERVMRALGLIVEDPDRLDEPETISNALN